MKREEDGGAYLVGWSGMLIVAGNCDGKPGMLKLNKRDKTYFTGAQGKGAT
jgi:hypothetical protein